MSTRLHIGESSRPQAAQAAAEAARAALDGVEHPVLAIALSAGPYDPAQLAEAVSHELGNIPWIGCSAPGVFVGARLMQQALALGVICSPQAYVGLGVAGPVSRNPVGVGSAAVARALDQLPPLSPARSRALLLFADALGGGGADTVRGALREGGTAIAWAGGGVGGDNLGASSTAQFARGVAYRDYAVAAVLDLPAPIGVGMRHGWSPYGPPLTVTRARAEIAHQLEYEPAFEVYRRIAVSQGDSVDRDSFAPFAMTHPLGIPQADGEYVIRDPLNVELDGGLRFVTEVPAGSLVRMMQASQPQLVLAAREAAEKARLGAGGALGGALVFDCVSRYMLLGERFGGELEAIQSALGPAVPMFGCLTFGEIGALGAGVPQFHNKTAVVLALPGADAAG
jgi:hypothetical protein